MRLRLRVSLFCASSDASTQAWPMGVYGRTTNARVFDPRDPSHVFSWLICESYDDKGNAIHYEYAAENSSGVDLAKPNERNRALVGARKRKGSIVRRLTIE